MELEAHRQSLSALTKASVKHFENEIPVTTSGAKVMGEALSMKTSVKDHRIDCWQEWIGALKHFDARSLPQGGGNRIVLHTG